MKFQYSEGWAQWGHRSAVWGMGTGTRKTEHYHTTDKLPTAMLQGPGLFLLHAEDTAGHHLTEIIIDVICVENVRGCYSYSLPNSCWCFT